MPMNTPDEPPREQAAMTAQPPTLWIVATPIGNLGDWSDRARATMVSADLIVAEDTRVTRTLWNAAGLRARSEGVPRWLSLHEHNEDGRVDTVVVALREGQRVVLVSDAGMPVVSDPGFVLVRRVRELGLEVRVVPGASAVLAALAASGLPPDRFTFVGFPPHSGARRIAAYDQILARAETTVLFESSHRVLDAARILAERAPERLVSLQREITKAFEEHFRGPAVRLPEWLEGGAHRQKGEFVLVVQGRVEPRSETVLSEAALRLVAALDGAIPLRGQARVVAQTFGLKSNAVYAELLSMRGRSDSIS